MTTRKRHQKAKNILFIEHEVPGNLDHHYMPKLAKLGKKMLKDGISIGVHHVDIFHDDWCDLLNNKGPCNCNPDVTQRHGTPETN